MSSAPISLAQLAACPGTFLSLAPMDGVTDAITRALLTEYNPGPAGISHCTSEFVRVTQQAVVPKVLLRLAPELANGGRTPSGVPVFVQLLGGDPAPMAESARRAASMGALGIDLNFGCPAKTVNRHDGGATLLKYPERLRGITAAVRDALPPHIPLSVKIRTGWADHDQVECIARAAEAGGAAFLTVHGRTRMDMYRPPANLEAIARARGAVAIPVLANGDLCAPADLTRCAAQTGCEAFMIGRGAMAQPNLFQQLRGVAGPMSLEAYGLFLVDYALRMVRAEVPDHRALGRLKSWVALSAAVRPTLRPLFEGFKRASTLKEACQSLGQPHGLPRALPDRPMREAQPPE